MDQNANGVEAERRRSGISDVGFPERLRIVMRCMPAPQAMDMRGRRTNIGVWKHITGMVMKIGILLTLGIVVASSLGLPAQAQSRLPRTSPAERTYTDINRNLERRERNVAIEQQNQFEVNQLRQELNRRELFAPPPRSGIGRICTPGQIAC